MSKHKFSLASRAISAEKARRCCVRGVIRTEQTILRLVGEMLDEATSARAAGGPGGEISLGTVTGKSLLDRGGNPPTRTVSPDFERLLQRSSPSDFDRLVRQEPPANLKIRRLPPGQAAGLGSIVLIGAQGLSSIAAQAATIETLAGVLEMLTLTKLETDDCEACVRKGMWKQNRKQVKQKGTIRRRV